MPKKAEIHIQNTAPGPPAAMAPATPATLPTPMVLPSAVETAWKGVTLVPSDLCASLFSLWKRVAKVFFQM